MFDNATIWKRSVSAVLTGSASNREKVWGRFVSWHDSTDKSACNPSPVEGTDNSLWTGLPPVFHLPGKRFLLVRANAASLWLARFIPMDLPLWNGCRQKAMPGSGLPSLPCRLSGLNGAQVASPQSPILRGGNINLAAMTR
jgi:hypothetical protein